MAIKKTAGGKYQVLVYDPAIKRKKYVGTRDRKRDAEQLERDTITAIKRAGKGLSALEDMSVREYAEEWLEIHHGEGTGRPSPTTLQVNEGNLRVFLEDFGDRPIRDGIKRREALAWAKPQGWRAKTVSAMFNDAIDDEVANANPFANRRHKRSDERRHIHPLTEAEVDQLADIALERWGRDGYGLVARAWVLFGAWEGTRPGETFGVCWKDLDLDGGTVTVRRVKGRMQTEAIALADQVCDAIQVMPGPRTGLLFPTVTGKLMAKGAVGKHWGPVRDIFQTKVTPERWAELLDGQKFLDFYVCRHFCASIIVARGGNEYDVAAQLGNTPEVCRETYIHDYKERTRERIRGFLNRGVVVELAVERERRTGSKDG